ncbi:histidine kinase [Sphingomonas cannabina]|uniref:histidine kinase n=1 Tax=Sphingomonas cannabina TaxID=2899123 RepID=UPI001F1EC47F|nr:histidine kinase [Sphingomonas cannabina]UIJ46312.1 histidine kinase [Sphingomonas cannabina]
MTAENSILLFISDASVLASLQFALSLEGFQVADGLAAANPSATCLVIDQACRGGGLDLLASLRAGGCNAPALLLATNPGAALRRRAGALGATIIEKPLLGDELTRALRRILQTEAA